MYHSMWANTHMGSLLFKLVTVIMTLLVSAMLQSFTHLLLLLSNGAGNIALCLHHLLLDL